MSWKCASIDMDETLYCYSAPLYKSFVDGGINIPSPENWTEWDYFYPNYMDKETALKHFDSVHERQMEFSPYKDAREFMLWAVNNYYVVVTSHRKNGRKQGIIDWLKKNNILFDEVWIGEDKTKMFNNDTFGLVVDDNPYILEDAASKGIKAYGNAKPWNKCCENTKGVVRYNSLEEIWK